MGTLTSTGYRVTTAGEHIQAIRDEIDTAIGAQDYDGTLLGYLTASWGERAYAVDQGAESVIGALDPRTAVGVILAAYAAEVGLSRLPATASRYIVRATVAAGTLDVAAGTVIQDPTTGVRWSVAIAATVTTSPTLLTVDAVDTGPMVLGATVAFGVVTPTTKPLTVTYDSSDGDEYTVGRVRESDALLRVRRSRSLVAVPAPSRDGIRAGVLALPYVTACSVARASAGVVAVTLYPEVVGADRQTAVAAAIGVRLAGGDITQSPGDASATYTLDDGTAETIYWLEGGAQAVVVLVNVTTDTGVALADVTDAVTSAIGAVFAGLEVGATVRYSAVYCAAAEVEGVVGIASLTLDGGTADITPASSADFLTSTITVL